MEPFRPTFAEINLSALKHNIAQVRDFILPRTKIMAIVKADGYGHGAIEVAKAAQACGADYLGVAYLGEAVELRALRIKSPILILSESPVSFVDRLVDAGITQTVYSYELAQALSDCAKQKKKQVKVHIKIDTGMGRVGILPEHALDLIKKIISLPNLFIEGIFTHFAKAEDTGNGLTQVQFEQFSKIIGILEKEGISIRVKHASGSAATINFKEYQMDMVRIGIVMYGLYPPGQKNRPLDLKPVLSFKTKVLYLKRVPAGATLSYGATYVTKKETTIATLPVGYADGLSRALSNKGHVLIKGKKYPVVGRVTMDMTLVDVGDDRIEVWDDVTMIGQDGKEKITADDIAASIDSINYEVLCGIGKRVPRVYTK